MKTFALSLFCTMLVCSCSNNQAPQQEVEDVVKENFVTINSPEKFKLYETANMWTFLKLDTSTGQIWQVQYSIKGEEYRFETPLSIEILNHSNKNGRYELIKTQNMYNFILLDTFDGQTYQVQWSTEPENRCIIPIN